MQNKSPTLGVIAQVAGLSKRAVIQALKDRPGVSDETRKRVKAIAKEYGYGNQSPTLEDISRSLGISKTSVSVALNGGYGVSESTRSKVKAAAQKLGYEINPLISSMMNQVQKGRSKISGPVLGFAVLRQPKTVWPFLGDVRTGIQNRALQLGYKMEEFRLGENGVTFDNLWGHMRKRGVEGVVISDVPGSKKNLPQ